MYTQSNVHCYTERSYFIEFVFIYYFGSDKKSLLTDREKKMNVIHTHTRRENYKYSILR